MAGEKMELQEFIKLIELKNENKDKYDELLKDFEEVFSDFAVAMAKAAQRAQEKIEKLNEETESEDDDNDDFIGQKYY